MSVLHNTKLWLIIIAIGHIGLGAGGSYATYGNDELAIIGFFTVVGVYLLYAAFMLEGQAQARRESPCAQQVLEAVGTCRPAWL